MARWATLVEIAGVSFTGCRAEIVDPAGFLSIYAGSVDWANDGTAHVQVFNRGVKGIPFGIKMVSSAITSLSPMVAAVQAAQAADLNFRVKITEGLYTIDVMAVPDYNASPSWLTHGKHSEGWYEDILMRFISEAVGA